MIDGKKVLAVIPARGGSKRCPRKNIKPFRGKPMVVWSIEEAKKSKYIDYLICSTDDEEIAGVALEAGCEVLMRPPHLADDLSTNEDVLRHVNDIFNCCWVVLLQPTSPLRTVEDIDGCIERAQMGNACITYRKDKTKNGAVYVARKEWLEKHDFSCVDHMRYVMDDERSLDVDYEHQFQ